VWETENAESLEIENLELWEILNCRIVGNRKCEFVRIFDKMGLWKNLNCRIAGN
jgi:hypothetical protein